MTDPFLRSVDFVKKIIQELILIRYFRTVSNWVKFGPTKAVSKEEGTKKQSFSKIFFVGYLKFFDPSYFAPALVVEYPHIIPKCKKLAGQNTFPILLPNDANMIREHEETRMKMLYGCPRL